MTKAKILVCDDEEIVRNVVRDSLSGPDFELELVSDGPSCIKQLHLAVPDLLLLDVRMPGDDGFKVLEQARMDPRTRDLPVVLLTAVADREYVQRAVKLGASDYITKPFEPKALIDRVRRSLPMMSFTDVLRLLDLLRFADESLLIQPQFKRYKGFAPYPTVVEGMSYCVMIAAGMQPKALTKLEEAEVAQHCVVFQQTKGQWRKIFPVRPPSAAN